MEIAITGEIYRPIESREELIHLSFWLRHHTDSLSFHLFIQQFSPLYHFCLICSTQAFAHAFGNVPKTTDTLSENRVPIACGREK